MELCTYGLKFYSCKLLFLHGLLLRHYDDHAADRICISPHCREAAQRHPEDLPAVKIKNSLIETNQSVVVVVARDGCAISKRGKAD